MAGAKKGGRGGGRKAPTPFDACYAGYSTTLTDAELHNPVNSGSMHAPSSRTHFPETLTNHAEKCGGLIQSKILLIQGVKF